MANVDEEFIKDLQQCLEAADQLSDLNTEEAKLFVSQQVQDLHSFLQKKQKDAEDRIDEEIKKEEKEISELKDRIERTTKSDGTKESDIAYRDLGLLWTVLKDEYWQFAFNAFISETKDSVKDILASLIVILKVSFRHCKDRAEKSRTDMMFQAYHPGENSQQNKDLKLPKKPDTNLVSICKKCQINSTPFCLPSILQAVMKDVKGDKSVEKHFKCESKLFSKEVEKYLEKCVEFSWIACFEEPVVSLITMPMKECSTIANDFEELENTTHSSRPTSKFVEWPAIVQGNKILFQWHLRLIKQPRPQPIDTRGDPSQDFRVIGVEGREGDLHDDEEDTTKDTPPTQSEMVSVSSDAHGSIGKKGLPEGPHTRDIEGKHENENAGANIIAGKKKTANLKDKDYKPVSTQNKHKNLKF